MRFGALFGALALVLAGCMTASHKLPLEQIVELRVTEVNVTFADSARIVWENGTFAYAKSKGMPPREAESVALQPEGQAFLRNLAAAKFKAGMEKQLSLRFKGSNAVRVDVLVKEITVIPIRARALGGHHTVTVEATMVDLRTKSVLLSYPEQTIRVPIGRGLVGVVIDAAVVADPVEFVAHNFAWQYAEWVKPSDPPS